MIVLQLSNEVNDSLTLALFKLQAKDNNGNNLNLSELDGDDKIFIEIQSNNFQNDDSNEYLIHKYDELQR